MNITDQLKEILVFLAKDCFVAPFKHVSGLAMSKIEILAVKLSEPLHEFRQWLFGAFNQQMDVIGHQEVRVQHIVIFLAVPRQPFNIGLIITFRSEGLLPLVAPTLQSAHLCASA